MAREWTILSIYQSKWTRAGTGNWKSSLQKLDGVWNDRFLKFRFVLLVLRERCQTFFFLFDLVWFGFLTKIRANPNQIIELKNFSNPNQIFEYFGFDLIWFFQIQYTEFSILKNQLVIYIFCNIAKNDLDSSWKSIEVSTAQDSLKDGTNFLYLISCIIINYLRACCIYTSLRLTYSNFYQHHLE